MRSRYRDVADEESTARDRPVDEADEPESSNDGPTEDDRGTDASRTLDQIIDAYAGTGSP